MRQNSLFTVLPLTVLLAACGGQTPPAPTVNSVSISGAGNGPVQTDTTLQLQATAKDANGTTITGKNVAWASSNPALVSVDANGKITARHLTDLTTPVTITAAIDGKSTTVNIATYGLDARGGTINDSTSPNLRTYIRLFFRNADGTTVTTDTPAVITGPTGFNAGNALDSKIFASTGGSGLNANAVPVTGQYSATATIGGKAYTKTFSIDATKTLGRVTNPSITLTSTSVSLNATAPSGAVWVAGGVYDQTTGQGIAGTGVSGEATKLPFTSTVSPALTPGTTYNALVFAYGYDSRNSTLAKSHLLPEQLNISVQSAGAVTVQ
ncbi:hypothetical protein [Deinococcus peraridilitoris]|uniref:hypothetical protein n=1 Tax=Deinococcus peraridilitoris TaxID=432329 RepID=UPI0002E2236E|nr:hypothetical protein [Deinococcus peraridilitoris]